MKIDFNIILNMLDTTYTIVLPIFIAWVVKTINQHNKKRNHTDESIKIILRMYLIDLHYRGMKQGHTTTAEYKTFMEIWELYHHAYHGNLLTDRYKEDMEKLEIKGD